ncbi:TPA: glycosyltransferase, partial [Escherichia coli]|nr:glycosyltransferase [Escherichia coli]
PQSELPIPFEVKWLGKLNDDVTLTVVYNSASVLVVPSKIDTFPQTATEAQSCGCPVVAFDTTGLSYLVEHKYSGYLAEPFDSNDLANGIEWVYTKQDEL